jgi:hypothetical protein
VDPNFGTAEPVPSFNPTGIVVPNGTIDGPPTEVRLGNPSLDISDTGVIDAEVELIGLIGVIGVIGVIGLIDVIGVIGVIGLEIIGLEIIGSEIIGSEIIGWGILGSAVIGIVGLTGV